MSDSRDFKKEYNAFLKKVPYQTAVIDGVEVRYQYGGKDGAPVILFFNGLEMQEMWMPYAEKLGKEYRFLIYEYPFHTTSADGQIDFAAKLLKALSIEKVILSICGERYRFSFRRKTCSKKRIRTVLQIYSGNWMQKSSVFPAGM